MVAGAVAAVSLVTAGFLVAVGWRVTVREARSADDGVAGRAVGNNSRGWAFVAVRTSIGGGEGERNGWQAQIISMKVIGQTFPAWECKL